MNDVDIVTNMTDLLLKLAQVAWNTTLERFLTRERHCHMVKTFKKSVLHNTLPLKRTTFVLLLSARWFREITLHTPENKYFKHIENTVNLCKISWLNPQIPVRSYIMYKLWNWRKSWFPFCPWLGDTVQLAFERGRKSPCLPLPYDLALLRRWLNSSFTRYLLHLCVHLLQPL